MKTDRERKNHQLNIDNSAKLRDTEPHRDEESEDEQYKFLNETVKQRPVDLKCILRRTAGIIVGACLFGAIAAGVFIGITDKYRSSQTKPVNIGADSDESEVMADSTGEDSGIVTSEALDVESEAENPPVEPAAEPELTAEEKLALALDNYESLHSSLAKIGEEAEKSCVIVSGIEQTEDLFNFENSSSTEVCGLIVGDNSLNLLILTEYRPLKDANSIIVKFDDGTSAAGTVLSYDTVTQFAVVSVAKSELSEETIEACPVASFDTGYGLRRGEIVIAIGSPMGYSGSIVSGTVTSLTDQVVVTDGAYTMLTTDITGSSDGTGVLVNTDGEVIGYIAQRFVSGNTSVISAIPFSQIRELAEKLSNGGSIAFAGINGIDVTTEVAEQAGLPRGVYVTGLDKDSPALEAGLQTADIITEMDGTKVYNLKALNAILLAQDPGDKVAITVMRKGADGYVDFDFDIELGGN